MLSSLAECSCIIMPNLASIYSINNHGTCSTRKTSSDIHISSKKCIGAQKLKSGWKQTKQHVSVLVLLSSSISGAAETCLKTQSLHVYTAL